MSDLKRKLSDGVIATLTVIVISGGLFVVAVVASL